MRVFAPAVAGGCSIRLGPLLARTLARLLAEVSPRGIASQGDRRATRRLRLFRAGGGRSPCSPRRARPSGACARRTASPSSSWRCRQTRLRRTTRRGGDRPAGGGDDQRPAAVSISDAVHADEHALEVQLPFLQAVLDDFSLLPLAVGDASPQAVAQVLERLWGGDETLIVVAPTSRTICRTTRHAASTRRRRSASTRSTRRSTTARPAARRRSTGYCSPHALACTRTLSTCATRATPPATVLRRRLRRFRFARSKEMSIDPLGPALLTICT